MTEILLLTFGLLSTATATIIIVLKMRERISAIGARLAASQTMRRLWLPTTVFLSLMVLLGIFLAAATYVSEIRRNFDCYFVDGCFQMFNPLRRWAAGQLPGRDFQFFYGLGTLWLHSLPFRLFGGDLLASEASRALMQPLCMLLATFAVLRCACGRFYALAGTAIIGLASMWFMPSLLMVINNPMGVRAFAAVSLAAVFFWLFSRQRNEKNFLIGACAAGAWAGAAFFMSHDQGTAAIVAGLVAMIFFASPRQMASRLIASAAFLVGTVTVVLIAYGLTAGPFLFDALRYNLIEASGDQFWYFGVDPMPYLGEKLMHEQWRRVLLMIGAPAVFLIALFRGRRLIAPEHRPAVVYLAIYGVLSLTPILGQFQNHYFSIAWWCFLLIALIVAWDARSALSRALGSFLPLIAAAGLVSAVFIAAAFVIKNARDLSVSLMSPAVSRTVVLGVHPSRQWREDLYLFDELLADAQGAASPLWSTFASLPEATHGLFSPDTDYIIHALGPARRRNYLATFDEVRPSIVRTTRLPWGFEPWFWHQHWDFYERLALNYDIAGHDEVMTGWTRKDADWRGPEDMPWIGDLAIEPDGRTARWPADMDGKKRLIAARLDYEITNPWSWLPVLGRTPRFMVDFTGTANRQRASLSPDIRSMTVPLIDPGPSSGITVTADTYLPFVKVRLKGVKYRVVETDAEMKKFFGL